MQRLTEPGLGGLDVAAEVFGGGHDAVTAGQVESRTPVTLRFTEITEVQRDVGQADEYRDPFGGIVDERHLGLGQSALEIPAHEREFGAEQPDAAVFYRKEPDQLLGFGPVAQDDQHAREAGAELFDVHVRPEFLVQHQRGVVHPGPFGL